jgi:hypothetical protein
MRPFRATIKIGSRIGWRFAGFPLQIAGCEPSGLLANFIISVVAPH